MSNKISIAIATYNGERFLREQLDSLYSQTRIPDEIVVCDDCSTDSTSDILEEYHQKYGLTYYISPKSLGVNKNFFKAISLCTGDYICICDQDDIWMSNKVETLYNAIKMYDDTLPNCVSSQRIDIDANRNQIGKKDLLPDTEGWQATLLTTGRSQGCTMILNQVLKTRAMLIYNSFPAADSIMYDGIIAFVAAIEGNKKNLGIPLMYYRHHEHNVVDKYREHKMTMYEKTQARPTYYPFLSDMRIANLATLSLFYLDKDIATDILFFLKRMAELHQCTSIFQGLYIICSLPISVSQKIKICIMTPISKALKILLQ